MSKIPNIQDIAVTEKVHSKKGEWKIFILFVFGKVIKDNCGRLPKTSELLLSIPGITSAWLSVLAPGKKLKPHRGYYKGILRCHLGIRIPEGRVAGICVNGEIRFWEQGKCLIFDDNFTHHVWNNSNEYRVVLWLDFLRPLPFWLTWLNKIGVYYFAQSQLIKDILKRQSVWNQKVFG